MGARQRVNLFCVVRGNRIGRRASLDRAIDGASQSLACRPFEIERPRSGVICVDRSLFSLVSQFSVRWRTEQQSLGPAGLLKLEI